jgi:hypothetical protein
MTGVGKDGKTKQTALHFALYLRMYLYITYYTYYTRKYIVHCIAWQAQASTPILFPLIEASRIPDCTHYRYRAAGDIIYFSLVQRSASSGVNVMYYSIIVRSKSLIWDLLRRTAGGIRHRRQNILLAGG